MGDVEISQEAVNELLRDINGPVGDLMRQIANQIAASARAHAPVRTGNVWSNRSSGAKKPGYTKENITTTVGHSVLNDGVVFGGANAPGDPTFFLQKPAEQMHHKYPFLTDALWSVRVE